MLTYAGAELALQIWDSMKKVGVALDDGVHPHASERIAALRDALRDRCNSEDTFEMITMAAKIIERAFIEVEKIILQPGEHGAIFNQEAEKLINEFTDLLDRCSNGLIPDYANFYTKAPVLLSVGYPEAILKEVFETVTDGFKKIMSRDRDNTEILIARKRTNQFKLLFGLAGNLPMPIRLVYEGVFDRLKN